MNSNQQILIKPINHNEIYTYEYIREQNNPELNKIVPTYYGTDNDGTRLLI